MKCHLKKEEMQKIEKRARREDKKSLLALLDNYEELKKVKRELSKQLK